jgi:integrase
MKAKRKAIRFSKLKLDGQKAGAKRYHLYEDGGRGFGLRVDPSGRRSFFISYRMPGDKNAKTITIGRYPDIGLAQARKQAAQLLLDIEKGVTPGVEKAAKKQAMQDADTIKALADKYIKHHAIPHKSKKACAEDMRILKKDILPAWGKRKAVDITRKDICALLDRIMERGAPTGANRTRALISTMFNFAVGRDILEVNKCVGVPKPAKEKSRDRKLSEQEVIDVWAGLSLDSGVSMAPALKLAVKFLLLTVQRKTEVLESKWEELDLDKKCWTLSGDRTKNNKAHDVPLSPLAIKVLEEARVLYPHSEWVFPSPNGVLDGKRVGGVAPFHESSLDHAIKRTLSDLGAEPFTPHDLRRTASSMIAELGIDRLTLKKILNHTDSEVTAIYDQHTYLKEKKKALLALSNKISALVTPSEPAKILPMRNEART